MTGFRVVEIVDHWRAVVTGQGMGWHPPVIGTLDDGDIEISWCRIDKMLIYSIWADGKEDYLKVWGSHMTNDMEEGENPTDEQIVELWRWLYPELVTKTLHGRDLLTAVS